MGHGPPGRHFLTSGKVDTIPPPVMLHELRRDVAEDSRLGSLREDRATERLRVLRLTQAVSH